MTPFAMSQAPVVAGDVSVFEVGVAMHTQGARAWPRMAAFLAVLPTATRTMK